MPVRGNEEIMKILSITAQKPHSTGSGIYLTEVVKSLAANGVKQAVVAGVYKEDEVCLPKGTAFHPVYFHTEELPYAIPGMSDEMPYESTVYGKMTEEMTEQFQNAFLGKIMEVYEHFQPDVILCHHLYLLTACVRNRVKDCKVIGICHGTGLRQMKKISLKNDFIRQEIQTLDLVLALQEDQKSEIMKIYQVPEEKIRVVGVGYNSHIFFPSDVIKEKTPVRLVFAGKLSEKKGVMSLLRCLQNIAKDTALEVVLCGGHGNEKEYEEIKILAQKLECKVDITGKLSQEELSKVFQSGHIFVLPSFYEGLPLVLMEALACGMNVVCTNLPGIKEWLDSSIPGHGIQFVKPPVMQNTDEAVKESLPEFECRLAQAVMDCIHKPVRMQEGLKKLSWEGIGNHVLEYIEEIYKN